MRPHCQRRRTCVGACVSELQEILGPAASPLLATPPPLRCGRVLATSRAATLQSRIAHSSALARLRRQIGTRRGYAPAGGQDADRGGDRCGAAEGGDRCVSTAGCRRRRRRLWARRGASRSPVALAARRAGHGARGAANQLWRAQAPDRRLSAKQCVRFPLEAHVHVENLR